MSAQVFGVYKLKSLAKLKSWGNYPKPFGMYPTFVFFVNECFYVVLTKY